MKRLEGHKEINILGKCQKTHPNNFKILVRKQVYNKTRFREKKITIFF